jgi:hypothetical protein
MTTSSRKRDPANDCSRPGRAERPVTVRADLASAERADLLTAIDPILAFAPDAGR